MYAPYQKISVLSKDINNPSSCLFNVLVMPPVFVELGCKMTMERKTTHSKAMALYICYMIKLHFHSELYSSVFQLYYLYCILDIYLLSCE